MRPQFRPLTLFRAAIAAGILPHGSNDRNTRRRASKAWNADPGDCAGDFPFLAALAIAEACIGRSSGWIPAVQSLAYEMAKLPAFATIGDSERLDAALMEKMESLMETGSGNAPELCEDSRPAWSAL